jgi:hypothetical protein
LLGGNLAGKARKILIRRRSASIPKLWAVLDFGRIIVMTVSRNWVSEQDTPLGLWILLLANLIAFAMDVFLVDDYRVL